MNIRDCKHGKLARSCDICDMEETIRCMTETLDKIGAMLGVEPGDVDGIGAAIEGLTECLDNWNHVAAEFYRHTPMQQVESMNPYAAALWWMGQLSEREALAAGEAE